jgi:hypothetical protein
MTISLIKISLQKYLYITEYGSDHPTNMSNELTLHSRPLVAPSSHGVREQGVGGLCSVGCGWFCCIARRLETCLNGFLQHVYM